jgi:16S rRNA (guanine527-N7)-methyltransferase
MLARDGVRRGVIGPREVHRVWDRHILNSAVVQEVLEWEDTVVDIGSGAGLPGVPIALARPDVRVVLLEPMERRVAWLEDVVDELELRERMTVVRSRAEDHRGPRARTVVSRAVAGLDRLFPWCAALAVPGGRIVALKGARAGDELAGVAARLSAWGVTEARVARFGEGVLAEPTTAIVATSTGRGGARGRTTVAGPAGRHGRLRHRRST